MFAGVARYVCRPQVEVVVRMESNMASLLKASQAKTKTAAASTAAPALLAAQASSAPPSNLASICGNDSKLLRMVKRHLASSPCALTRTKGIDLDTMLRRDHAIPLNDFLTLSTVNRKILLLDSLKRHNADLDTPDASAEKATNGLSATQRHDMILERGRELLLQLHRNAKKQ